MESTKYSIDSGWHENQLYSKSRANIRTQGVNRCLQV